jgi:hypothetical protein
LDVSTQVQHRRDVNTVMETVTPAVGELGLDTTKLEPLIGDGVTLGGVRVQKKNTREILLAAQIVANTNDYNPTGLKHAGTVVISTDASRNLTGLVPVGAVNTVDGREVTLYNGGSFNAVIQDQNVASSAANRFDLGGADITLAPKQSITLGYRTQGALNRWEIRAGTYGQAISDGAVSARKLAASSLGAFSGMINGTLVESHAGNAATYAVKTLAGTDPSATDPVYFTFRDVTAATGDFVVRTVTAALSLVLSAGSSMGFASGVAGKFHITAIDNAGAVLLGAINCLNGNDIFPLAGFGVITTVAEGGAGAADNPQVMYAASAVTSKAYTLLGYAAYETGVATAGNWASSPTRLQLYGPGVPLPGQVVQLARSATGALATGTTVIPFDDTIPQNTEGDQYMSKAITPSSAANLLRVEAAAMLASSVSGAVIISALFQDSAANALAVIALHDQLANGILQQRVTVEVLAALTTATTFKLRAGGSAAGTVTFNGNNGSRVMGGAAASFLKIEEICT